MPGRPSAPLFHPDRCFDPDPGVRAIARELHAGTMHLPIVSPHGHIEARVLAENLPFADPASLLITPDHYITRMLHSQGIALEALGVSRRDGARVESNGRAIWQLFAAHAHLFAGTPTGYWLDYQLQELFGVGASLTIDTAPRIYDQIAERLASPEYRPRSLFERFDIELLATTDGAGDSLDCHRAIRDSGWPGKVIPTFRPDAVLNIVAPEWSAAVAALASAAGRSVASCTDLLAAIQLRRSFFRQMGATATDHGVAGPFAELLEPDEAERLFARAAAGEATADDQRRFAGHMLMEMARMSVDDGMVMQLHAGAFRNHDQRLYDTFGGDRGGDIPMTTEWTRNLRPLLNAFGNDSRFALILFTLDESNYSRELAPIAGYYSAVRLGAPWWFHDSVQGMIRYREQVTETAGIWNTAGFVDDTRAFCSIPARHDLARRIDANYLAGLVARHVIDMHDARVMARAMAHDLAWDAYRLGRFA